MGKLRILTLGIYLLVIAMAALVWSCSENENADGHGRLKVMITDAPFSVNLVEEAVVTLEKIELRQKNVEGNPYIVVFEGAVPVDLITLRNGITEELTSLEIPAGEYDQVRVYVDDAHLKLTNGMTFHLKVPSGSQSGIKIFVHPGITVTTGLTAELLLDFDVSKSFVVKGNPHDLENIKGFNFKPVIRAVNNSFAGRIDGYVWDEDEIALEGATVWLEKDSVVSTTVTDLQGYFAFIGIPEGSYNLMSAKEGYDTLVHENIKVTTANKSEINLQLTESEK